jgi:hypothetical protein
MNVIHDPSHFLAKFALHQFALLSYFGGSFGSFWAHSWLPNRKEKIEPLPESRLK